MRVVRFGCIVEGHGEVRAVPSLMTRIAEHLDLNVQIVTHTLRTKRDRFIRDEQEFFRFVRMAAAKAGEGQPVLILLDSEGECPAQLGSQLRERLRENCKGRPTGVVLAHQEFEAWFLSDPDSFARHFGLRTVAAAPDDPEIVRGAKEWIRKQLPPGRRYSETIDQEPITRQLNIAVARNSPSFARFCREVERLTRETQGAC